MRGRNRTPHPARRKLAGREEGGVYDRLYEAQVELERGACGTEKPLSCSAALIARVAALGRADGAAVERLLGPRRAERFGPAFLEVLRTA